MCRPLPEEEWERGNVGELATLEAFRVRILPVLGPIPSVVRKSRCERSDATDWNDHGCARYHDPRRTADCPARVQVRLARLRYLNRPRVRRKLYTRLWQDLIRLEGRITGELSVAFTLAAS